MEAVKSFNDELSGIYETKPPISRAKMTTLTKKAIKGIKYYKHIVQSIEKFIQKCRPEYKVPGLYVIDSVVRQSRHQFGADKDVFMPRLCKNIIQTFTHIYLCPADQKSRILRVLNLWQKNTVFPIETVQQLMIMGGAPAQNNTDGSDKNAGGQHNVQDLTSVLVDLLANPDTQRVEDLAKILSTSQRQQIEQLLKKVEKNEDTDESKPHEPQSAYGRGGVLDFDYEGDEKTPERQMDTGMHHHHHQQPPPPLPPHLRQFTSESGTSPSYERDQPTESQPPMSLRQLEEEQKNFDQQLQQITGDEGCGEMDMDFSGEMAMMNSEQRKRSRSSSRSRDKRHRRHNRSPSRGEQRSRHRSRSRDRSSRHRSRRSRSREERRRPEHRKGMPPLKTGYISVCSKTVWIGNISGKVSQTELQEIIEGYGTIENINMIPPRGCAYIVMESRQDASFALRKLKHQRLGGKSLKCDWAASKDMPDEQKSTWVKENGVNYVPNPNNIGQLESLGTWGFIDPDSVPEHLRASDGGGSQQQSSQQQLLQQQGPPPPPMPPMSLASITSNPPPKFPFINQQLLSSVANSVMTLNAAGAANQQQQQQRNFILNNQQHPPHHQHQQPPPQLLVRSFAPTNAVPQSVAATITSTVEPMDLDGGSPEREITLNRGHQQQQQQHPMDQHQQEMNNPSMVPPHHMHQPPVSGAQFGPISIAQRFPGPHMPVQIRMMPAMAGQPGVMQHHRMGLMPLRMSIPMQMRPGFHAVAAQRMPAGHGPPGHPMLTNHMPPHLHQAAGFPIRMMRPPMHPQERIPQHPEHVHVQGLGPRGPVPPPQMAEQNSIVPPQVVPTAARISEEAERSSTADNAESHEGSPFVRNQQPPPNHPPPHQEGAAPNTEQQQNHRGGMPNGGATTAPKARASRFSDITAEDPGIPPPVEDQEKMFGGRQPRGGPPPPPPTNEFPPQQDRPFGGRQRGGDNRDDFDNRRNRDWDSRGGRDNEGRGRRDMRDEPPWRQQGGGNDRGGYRGRGRGGNDDYRSFRSGPPPPEDRPYHGGFNRGGGFGGQRGEMMSRGGGGGGWSGRRSPRGGRSPPRMRAGSPGGRGGRSPSGGRRSPPPRSDRARSPSMIYGARGGGGDRDHRRGGRDERRASRTSENNDEDHHRRRRHSPRSRDEDEESRKRRLWLENNNSEQEKAADTTGTNKEEGEVDHPEANTEVQQGEEDAAAGGKVEDMEATTTDGGGDMMPSNEPSNQADVTVPSGGAVSDEEGQIVEDKMPPPPPTMMTTTMTSSEGRDGGDDQVEVREIISSKPDVDHVDDVVVADSGEGAEAAAAVLDSTIEEGEVPDDDDEVAETAGYEAA